MVVCFLRVARHAHARANASRVTTEIDNDVPTACVRSRQVNWVALSMAAHVVVTATGAEAGEVASVEQAYIGLAIERDLNYIAVGYADLIVKELHVTSVFAGESRADGLALSQSAC
jgi:hypothetical protein